MINILHWSILLRNDFEKYWLCKIYYFIHHKALELLMFLRIMNCISIFLWRCERIKKNNKIVLDDLQPVSFIITVWLTKETVSMSQKIRIFPERFKSRCQCVRKKIISRRLQLTFTAYACSAKKYFEVIFSFYFIQIFRKKWF